ncbi:radical SAM protein [Luteimonas sp. RD2P54]|uniref:Radical SAM protein n=1 Tax=Luteimonas endophytica TaxID=3042023 RepID=A0ABT6J6S0_9GAMM|nr:radical SAM protein [Luteimonas endophytica]MDH5822262.1 radical SAM protein [Luteimonas endophytica]
MAMFTDMALAEALTDRRLELIILPTEKCNFRCTYCYEDFANGRIAGKLVSGIKKLLDARVGTVHHITISWFGGEPLLAKDVILDVGSYAHDLCGSRGVSLLGAMTTNAYTLDRDLLSSLCAIRHSSYQITLDGDAEWHDKTRLLANRNGTFDRIWSNLLSYRSLEERFSISLRLHLHRENVESVRRLYQAILRNFGHDDRFGTYFHRISNLSGERGIPQSELSTDEYRKALAYVTGEKSPANVAADVNLSDYICYAAKPNSLLIRSDGRIGKCTVALDDPRNDIGTLHEDGTLAIDNEMARLWFHGYESMSEQSLGCPLSTLPPLKETPQWLGSTQVRLV